MPGPQRNRSNDLSRERDANRAGRPRVTKGQARPTVQPEADPEWNELAKRIWVALGESGQADYLQPSDWAYAQHVMEELTYYKSTQRSRGRNGQILSALESALSKLLLTEADRRKAGIELESPPDPVPSASVAVMADYRTGLGIAPDHSA